MRGLVSHTRGLETSPLATALPLACDLGQGLAPAESQFLCLHKGYWTSGTVGDQCFFRVPTKLRLVFPGGTGEVALVQHFTGS